MTTRKEWLLLAIAQRRGAALTPVQIQKTMFLMKMEAGAYLGDSFYSFSAYNYGPFSSTIYDDLSELVSAGHIEERQSHRVRWSAYAVTPAGSERAERVERKADRSATSFLKQVVEWVSSVSFPELLRAIYTKYPKYAKNSLFTE
jgi:uncharacterized protein